VMLQKQQTFQRRMGAADAPGRITAFESASSRSLPDL
jgi:hypothetical protein